MLVLNGFMIWSKERNQYVGTGMYVTRVPKIWMSEKHAKAAITNAGPSKYIKQHDPAKWQAHQDKFEIHPVKVIR